MKCFCSDFRKLKKKPRKEFSLYVYAKWVPAFVLILIALNQFSLAHTANLSPWKGGGFGMFSVADERILFMKGMDAEGNMYEIVSPFFDSKISKQFNEKAQKRLLKIEDQKALKSISEKLLPLRFIADYRARRNTTFKTSARPNFPGASQKKVLPRIRPIRVQDGNLTGLSLIDLVFIEAQTFRIRFDANKTILYWEPIGESVTVRKKN